MKNTCIEGLSYWGAYQADRHIDFNGFHWATPAGGLLIDPMATGPDGLAELKERGGVRWILISNADHLRAGPVLKGALGAELWAPEEDRERLGVHAKHVDGWFNQAGGLPAELATLIDVWPLRGGKSTMEPAFYLKEPRALYFADLVRSHESGRLRLLPDPKIQDKAAVVDSVKALGSLEVQALLLGDGDGIYNGAKEAFASFLAEL